MFDAQLLIAEASSTTASLADWFPRQADNVLFTIEMVYLLGGGTPELKVEFFHKNFDDAPAAETVAATATYSSASRHIISAADVKEELRPKFSLIGDSGGTARVLFRMLPPVWYDSARV